ncbi:phytanoyl-CoA dioxygenase family protein [Pseudomonas sp. BNK-45]|uniref:phytanoyl-CoA dioxygenase family protein n=1 Tax=Pseudomonas sp. BNK-45 TaxID=3376180 RepID=UPI0039BF406A
MNLPSVLSENTPLLVNPLRLEQDDLRHFQERGFIKLRQLLTPTAIEHLVELADSQLRPCRTSAPAHGDGFSRLTHQLGQIGILERLYRQPAFAQVLTRLTGCRLIVSEAQSFELQTGRSGFAWHYDSLNFRYIRPQDPAFSLWLPLQPIRPEQQGGGMAWVPLSRCSAQANFQFSRLLAEKLARGEAIEDFSAHLRQTYCTPGLLTDSFEQQRIEDSFDPGDALLFSKYLWHRSSPLLPGDLQRRQAVSLRLLDWRARLDPLLQEGETRSAGGLGMGREGGPLNPVSYGSRFVDIQPGAPIRSSAHCGPIL